MSQRFSLFHAGYCANLPALYYRRHELAGQQQSQDGVRHKNELDKLVSELKGMEEQVRTKLQAAIRIARELEVSAPDLPVNGDGYFDWFPAFIEAFDSTFPMSRIDHYYFLFGRKVAELLVNLGFASSCVDLQLSAGNGIDLTKKIDKCIKDNEYILFKLIAPAALLSSEPRHNFFNVYYRSINAAFEPFRGFDAVGLDEASMGKLGADLRSYEQEVLKGYNSCEAQLRELGV